MLVGYPDSSAQMIDEVGSHVTQCADAERRPSPPVESHRESASSAVRLVAVIRHIQRR